MHTPQLIAWGVEVCARDRVVAALHALLCVSELEDLHLQLSRPLQGTAARSGMVNTAELRAALSALPGQNFGWGARGGLGWGVG